MDNNWVILLIIAIVLVLIYYLSGSIATPNKAAETPKPQFVLEADTRLDGDIYITDKNNSMFTSKFEAEELQLATKKEAAEYFQDTFGISGSNLKVNMFEHHSNPNLNYTCNGYPVTDVGYTLEMKDGGCAHFGLYMFGPYAIKYTCSNAHYANQPYECNLKIMRSPNADEVNLIGKSQNTSEEVRNNDGSISVRIRNVLTFE